MARISTTARNSDLIPMKSKVKHRFYEPLVILNALNFATKHTAESTVSGLSIDTQDLQQVFRAFIDKLGLLCDSVKGNHGSTVTSFTLLVNKLDQEKFHYLFACNQRTEQDLRSTATYIEGLLNRVDMLPGAKSQHQANVRTLLSYVLPFVRPRLTHYFIQMTSETLECLKNCREDKLMAKTLDNILEITNFDLSPESPDEDFVPCGKRAILELDRILSTEAGNILAQRARDGRLAPAQPSKQCWSNLQHMIGRTQAYLQSIKCILLVKDIWPELFIDFDVSFILSSSPDERPFRMASLQAVGIVGRMTRREKDIEIFRNFVAELQMFYLDDLIKKEYRNPYWLPIVHSEMLLLDWLHQTGQLQPHRFFNGWVYISGSKGTCKLCQYYFEAYSKIHRQRIGYRPTHGNIYLSWRFPDVHVSQGEPGEKARQVMIDMVLEAIRKEAFEMIRKKRPSSYKHEDSNTFTARVSTKRWNQSEVDVNVDDMASDLGQMDLNLDD